jgi:hypothetical protein
MLVAVRGGWQGAEEKLRPRGDGMRRTALSLGARGESRASEGSMSDAEAWRDEENELKEALAALGSDGM